MHSEDSNQIARSVEVEPIVIFDEVSKWYGNVIGINKLSLRIPAGVTGLQVDIAAIGNRSIIP